MSMSSRPTEPDGDAALSGLEHPVVLPGAALSPHPMDSEDPMGSGARSLQSRPSHLFRVTMEGPI
jgi:hypothetical protein